MAAADDLSMVSSFVLEVLGKARMLAILVAAVLLISGRLLLLVGELRRMKEHSAARKTFMEQLLSSSERRVWLARCAESIEGGRAPLPPRWRLEGGRGNREEDEQRKDRAQVALTPGRRRLPEPSRTTWWCRH